MQYSGGESGMMVLRSLTVHTLLSIDRDGFLKRGFTMKKTNTLIVRRVEPTQKRAEDSVQTILATTAALLDEVGVEGFNTNLLAERAGIRVRTVYRYFPNKYAVIIALTEALALKWDRWMGQLYGRLADPHADWRSALRDTRVEWLSNARRVPGSLSVLQAMNATPELQELHFRIFEDMSQKVATALGLRGLQLPAATLLSIARTVINAMNSGLDISLRLKGIESRQFVTELDVSQEAYLGMYLKDRPSRRSSR
jgi:AcrR family transcriptional regulator